MTSVLEKPTDEEAYLWAILSDPSGLDLAEFCWHDPAAIDTDECWRAWPYQWRWFRNTAPLQIDQCARSVGKSLSIKVRAFAFPFLHPNQEMVVTAPEGNHLDAITDLIETGFLNSRLGREMLVRGRTGIKHRPFHVSFMNGARIMGRIPQRDGKGVKGVHPLWLELDEGQDYPDAGWIEVTETLKRGHDGAVWRAHGVTKGVRDYFFKFTQDNSGWQVHRYCLPGDTLVYGVDKPVPIKDIEVGTDVWSVTEDGHVVIEPVTAKVCNGIKETWRVKTKDRSLVSTGNHPYLRLQNYGTRKTRRELRWEWVNAENLSVGDVIVELAEAPYLDAKHRFGKLRGYGDPRPGTHEILLKKSPGVPEWVWSAPRIAQEAFLHGYLVGDGSVGRQQRGQVPWQVGTSSKALAKQLLALCHYMGYRTTNLDEGRLFTSSVSKGVQYRFYVYPFDSTTRAQVPRSYTIHDLKLDSHLQARTVLSVEKTGRVEETWDITVGENHNFVAEGVVVHNTAMHRPTWSDAERQEKIDNYGSRDHPDYRRNVLGLHGDATNPLFVLHRLMKCVDTEESSDYNQNIYTHLKVNNELLLDRGGDIIPLLDFPASHKKFAKVFWAGMDVGFTNHPSEILVFGEVPNKVKGAPSVFQLLTRIHLERIAVQDQAIAMAHVMKWYGVSAFSMDRGGVGLPLFQLLQGQHPELASKIKDYVFNGKILVGIDETKEIDEYRGDLIKDAGMERNVLEYASDKLREYVDSELLRLPWDRELIGEFQGQTYTVVRDTMNMYGRREYSKGKFHALDAARMAILGMVQTPIDQMVEASKNKFEPITDIFLSDF